MWIIFRGASRYGPDQRQVDTARRRLCVVAQAMQTGRHVRAGETGPAPDLAPQPQQRVPVSFVERAHNVVILGPPGVAKTHLAVALGVKAVEAGYSVMFLTLETLMTIFLSV